MKQKDSTIEELNRNGLAASKAAKALAGLSSVERTEALHNISDGLESGQKSILAANKEDVEAGRRQGLSDALLDRLLLSPERLQGIASDVRNIAALPDPLGEMIEMRTLPNRLQVGRKRVPLGVIGAIYESRPNITVDIAALCIKSGNGCLLRGGKEAIKSNTVLSEVLRSSLSKANVPRDAVQLIKSTDRKLVDHMLSMKETIDLLIPRGGSDLIKFVADKAAMPVITGGIGVCHIYVDEIADLEKAVPIIQNAKVQRPTVCNAMDTLLIHQKVAPLYLPRIAEALSRDGVELRCDPRALAILEPSSSPTIIPAVPTDWGMEFLSLKAAVRVVDGVNEAVAHIETYGSGHTEAIVTEDYSTGMHFLNEVDAAVVMVNASTRFTDGAQFGLGAEVGISTQKFHARGPMGLRELTSYKWIVLGDGQTRT